MKRRNFIKKALTGAAIATTAPLLAKELIEETPIEDVDVSNSGSIGYTESGDKITFNWKYGVICNADWIQEQIRTKTPIRNGTFYISKPIIIDGNGFLDIENCRITANENFKGGSMIKINSNNYNMNDNYFDGFKTANIFNLIPLNNGLL